MDRSTQDDHDEAKFRLLFERSGDAILLLDTHSNRFVDYNQAALDMLRCNREELSALHPSVLSPQVQPDGRQSFEKAEEMIETAIRLGSHRFEWMHQSPHREEFPVEVLLTPIQLGDQPILMVVWRDITERKKAEESLRQAQRLESIGVLAGGIAHDFNNLLMGILGNVSTALEQLARQDALWPLLHDAEQAALRARGLTQQLLTFAKGGGPVRKVQALAPIVVDAAQFAARGSNVRLELDLPETLWPLDVDAGQIGQVVQNFVINACQAMPQGGVLEIGASNVVLAPGGPQKLPRGNYVRLSVTDHGGGIAAQDLPRIFDPYFTTKDVGRGLGLAVTRSIVLSHGGHIGVESHAGQGATFFVLLPASERPLPAAPQGDATPALGHGRVLIADDDAMVGKAIRRLLAMLGYEAELVGDGAAAIERYRTCAAEGRPFLFVILDLTIPGGMGGEVAVQHLLELDPDVRAIAASGYSNSPVLAEPARFGFRAVLPKPFTLQEVAAALRQAHGESAGNDAIAVPGQPA